MKATHCRPGTTELGLQFCKYSIKVFADRFLLVMLHVGVCLFLAALWSPAGKGLNSWLSSMLCFLVFCHFPKRVLVHFRIKGEGGAVKLVEALQ